MINRVKSRKRNVASSSDAKDEDSYLTSEQIQINVDKDASSENGELLDPTKSTMWNKLDDLVKQKLIELCSNVRRG
jgi:hypothetical protein